jgi:chloride channel protein, CIC family
VMIAKFTVLVVSLGSGTSGGLLAPTFMWSAAMGGLFAMIGNHIFPSAHLSPGAFALVAMGAVFGAASRATFSFIIFAFEITRDYNSVLPLMLVAVIADGIAMLFMPTSSIMTEKLARRGLRVHQDYEADALTQTTVGETMEKEAPIVAADTKVGALAERIARHDPAVARHEALLIVDEAGKLCGIITRGDILRALDKDASGSASVQEAGGTKLVVAYPDELVSEAAAKLLRYDVGRLPVVDRTDERKVVGYLGRASILAARLLRFHDEHVREPGWLGSRSKIQR